MKRTTIKKCLKIALVGMVSAALMLTTAYAQSEVKRLKVVGSWSSLTMYKNLENPFWTNTFPKEFDREIKIQMTSLGQVKLKGAAVLRQMRMGVFDVVSTVADYVVSDSARLAGLDLPAMAPQIDLARVLTEAYRPVVEDALADDFDARLLAIAPYPAQVLFCKNQIAGLKDLKGKKVRASGWTTSEFVTALGAAGVTISFGEVPQSLQRGVVDCAITGSLSGYSAGWGEVSSYLYPLPIGGWDYVITSMNMKTWNKFSASEQRMIQTLVKKHIEDPAWEVTEFETREGVNCLTRNKCSMGKPANMNLIDISLEDIRLSSKILRENVLPAWAAKVDKDTVRLWNNRVGRLINTYAE